ncbi:hypothetical protein ACP8HZ_07370 [Francisella noatunensis]
MKFKTLLSLSELFWNIFKDILVLLFLAIFVFVEGRDDFSEINQ